MVYSTSETCNLDLCCGQTWRPLGISTQTDGRESVLKLRDGNVAAPFERGRGRNSEWLPWRRCLKLPLAAGRYGVTTFILGVRICVGDKYATLLARERKQGRWLFNCTYQGRT